jgi:hypothetical protein
VRLATGVTLREETQADSADVLVSRLDTDTKRPQLVVTPTGTAAPSTSSTRLSSTASTKRLRTRRHSPGRHMPKASSLDLKRRGEEVSRVIPEAGSRGPER